MRSIIAITIGSLWLCAALAGCKSTTEILPLTTDRFIQTNVGDKVGEITTKKPGAWMSDELMLDQFGIILGK